MCVFLPHSKSPTHFRVCYRKLIRKWVAICLPNLKTAINKGASYFKNYCLFLNIEFEVSNATDFLFFGGL